MYRSNDLKVKITVVDIKNQKLFAFSEGMNDIYLELLCCFLNFTNIPGIALIIFACCQIFCEVDVKIVNNVR
jgi:hypothetical protein